MIKLKMNIQIESLCLALLALLLTGCAGFSGRVPPSYTYEQIPRIEQKPAISYDAKYLESGKEHAENTKTLYRVVKIVFLLSEVVSSMEAVPASDGYHLSVKMETDTNAPLAFLSGFISGLTFTIIPGFQRFHFTLTAEVKRGNELIKQYVYKDYMDEWIHIVMLPFMSTHYPTHVAGEVVEHMVRKLAYDMAADRILIQERTEPERLSLKKEVNQPIK